MSWFRKLLGVRTRFCRRSRTESTRRWCWATEFRFDSGSSIREDSKRWCWWNWIAECVVELDGGDCRGRQERCDGWGAPFFGGWFGKMMGYSYRITPVRVRRAGAGCVVRRRLMSRRDANCIGFGQLTFGGFMYGSYVWVPDESESGPPRLVR